MENVRREVFIDQSQQVSNIENVKKRERPNEYQGYDGVIQVPFVPSKDLILALNSENLGFIPEVLQDSLVQVKEGGMKAMKSGVRSSILEFNGKYYRLKGCGNNNERFISRRVEGEEENVYEIRGCMFPHTSSRAIFMSVLISDLLKKKGMRVCNTPIGIYVYDRVSDKKCKVEEEEGEEEGKEESRHFNKPERKVSFSSIGLEDVRNCCTLFETLGDKRLGDHVLTGLERLLPLVVKFPNPGVLVKQFSESRVDEEDGEIAATWALHIFAHEDYGGYVDMREFTNFELVIPDGEESLKKMSWYNEWEIFTSLMEKEVAMEDGSCCLKKVFSLLYHRLGFEVGNILKIMHENDVLWGTYMDRLGYHCNSHPNNLVLVPPFLGSREKREDLNLLSALDFDMAFTRDSFLGSEEEFQKYRKKEVGTMILSLAGMGINTGCRELEVMEDKTIGMFRMGLRDTLVIGFNEGYFGKEDRCSVDIFKEFSDNFLYSILGFALLLSADIVA